ncbi:sucrase ferredoxin [Nocardioides KLBMP 9356]|uniref:Sucrase ferredoxin n=1 Tax=Nocardioides potassii TaxID=2911371 RepID=A0ABS9H497_9ACTN|nr:sucrase ferredoxin [Nocardioides potassii]MCF6376082.1 sucrase ferredoxin [Nocardioides potassii]
MPDFRCSVASVEDAEPIIGTAPTDPEILLVECPGPWGREAVTDNRLPEVVRDHLAGLDLKVFLLRRYDGSAGPGTHVFHASATADGYDVRRAVLDRPEDLVGLDLGPGSATLTPYDDPLWLVCTNGKRDRCCAEIGRPIAGLLSEEWPDGTWETTHLGGHRFSGTLLALPSGLTLGRLDTATALAACEAVARGEVPLDHVRGRAGRSGVEQAHELHVLAGGDPADELVAVPGPPRRQSCGDDKLKGTMRYEVRALA